MQPTQVVTTREVSRNYKRVFERVRKTRQPTIVLNNREPQVAIIPIEDLKKLEDKAYMQSARSLLDMAGMIGEEAGLPADFAANHNTYAWDD